jgi:flagellar basal body-associated protein FliL
MAADKKETGAQEPAAEAAPPSRGKLILILLVCVIMLVETALFFFLVPSAEEVAALAEARLVQTVQQSEEEAAEAQSDENTPTEVQLGKFGETFSPRDTEARYTLSFRLFGLVKKKDFERMEKELEKKSGRLRHAIRMKVRNSDIGELEENQLGLLQRRILATCNHLLEDDLLLSVGFSDYQLIQD